MNHTNIYEYIKAQENAFQTEEIRLGDNWSWNFRDHVQLIFHLKNGVFYTGNNDYMRAFKEVMEPLLNLAYWTEDIEVKDVVFFIENDEDRIKSFLIKKYHDEVFTRQYDLDTLFDEITESDIDYGGVVVQDTKTGRPEVLQLNTIAFADQKNLLGGPIGFKHHFSPDALRKMSKAGWGEESNGATISIEELIVLANSQSNPDGMTGQKKNKSTGKTIEVYVVRGELPEHYLKDNDNIDDWYGQVQVVAYYTDKHKRKQGVTLYRKTEKNSALRFHTSKKVQGRALGRGTGESLIHPQIWTNFLTIHKMGMLEASSKVVLQSDDENFADTNQVQDMDNLEVVTTAQGTQVRQIPNAAQANIALYENSINEWFQQSQLIASAQDPILGKEAVSGTTFRGQERTVAQGRGMHDRRRGQRAKFIEQLYRDMMIPNMVREITKGKKFLASLTVDELSWISEQLATNYANSKLKNALLDGKAVSEEDKQALKQTFKESFTKDGNRKMLEILKGEFDGVEIQMGINIANKQKNLADLSDKVLNIFQFAFANPNAFSQAMQNPGLAKSFNDILEFSGLSQSDFTGLMQGTPQPPQAPTQQAPQELAINQPAPAQ